MRIKGLHGHFVEFGGSEVVGGVSFPIERLTLAGREGEDAGHKYKFVKHK